jgi:hypothetical protein
VSVLTPIIPYIIFYLGQFYLWNMHMLSISSTTLPCDLIHMHNEVTHVKNMSCLISWLIGTKWLLFMLLITLIIIKQLHDKTLSHLVLIFRICLVLSLVWYCNNQLFYSGAPPDPIPTLWWSSTNSAVIWYQLYVDPVPRSVIVLVWY